VYSKFSVDAAVASLNSAVHETIDRSIPRGSVKDLIFPRVFPHSAALFFEKRIIITDILKE
jgi:hypothetical protein